MGGIIMRNMAKTDISRPTSAFHPGEILLAEFLQPGKIMQAAFAGKLGWTLMMPGGEYGSQKGRGTEPPVHE
jgi:hypothetical protein